MEKKITFRDLLKQLQGLTDEQLDCEVKILPTNGDMEYSPMNVELAYAKGDIVMDEQPCSPQCGCTGGCFCSDTEEWFAPASELDEPGYDKDDIILPAGMPYFKVSTKE